MTPKELLAKYQPKDAKPIIPAKQLGVVRFSRCGKFMAAGSFDGSMLRWEMGEAPKELAPLAGHRGWVQALAFHPDGRRMFSADSWGGLRAWSYADGKLLWSIEAAHAGWIRKLSLSPDGNSVATCGVDHKIRGWNCADGKKTFEYDQQDDVFTIAFHPTGKHLASGDLHGNIKAWDLASGKVIREFDAKSMYLYERIQDVGGVRTLAFDASGKFLACGGAGPATGGFVESTPQVLVFDWASGKVEHRWNGVNKTEGFVHELLWHPDGFLMGVCSGQPGQGRFFFLKPGDTLPFFVTNKMQNCHSLDMHPDGRRLAVSATNANSSGNGRMTRNGEYPANSSPITLWELPKV